MNIRNGAHPMITVVEKTNPKKPGSKAHARYAILLKTTDKAGKADEAALIEAGYTKADIAHDRAKGFIK